MFRTPEAVYDERARVLEEIVERKLDAEEAGRRLLAADPNCSQGLLALGGARMADNDLDAAEPLLWRALAGAPGNPGYYLPLAALYRQRGDQRMSTALAALAMRQMSFYESIPEPLRHAVENHLPELGDSAGDPSVYVSMAETAEQELEGQPWPDQLAPYRVLSEIQREAAGGLSPERIAEVVALGAPCIPVFVAAIRESWESETTSLSAPAEALLLALLGEIGDVELIDGLLALDDDEEDLFLHAQWAIFRLGQRHPQAAFDRLRAVAERADPAVRAAIAEHFYFLREQADARRAMLGLLDGFERFCKQEMAAFLLMTVSTLLAMSDSPADALEVIKRHERQLSKNGRGLLHDMMSAEEPFVPELLSYGVDEASVEAVCCDLALLSDEDNDHDHDHDHDHDEESEDDYLDDEDADDLPPTPKPGRNEPCWCGSGKKYKKCHLEADEKEAREAPERDREADLFRTAWERLLDASRQYHRPADMKEALRLYFSRSPEDVDHEALPESGFVEWYALDYQAPSMRRTVVAEFLRRHGPRLTDEMRELIESWRDNRFALWEVQRIELGKGVEITDVFEGDTIFVDDVSTSETVVLWDCMISRAHRFHGQWLFAGNGFLVPRPLVDAVREAVQSGRRKAGVPAGQFFREHSYQWRRFVLEEHAERIEGLRIENTDGDPLEFSSAEYEVSAIDAVLAALLADPEFHAGAQAGEYVWTEPEGERRLLGRVEIGGGKLRLECNSRRRLELGRKRIEERCGELVRHIGDTFESLDEVKRRAQDSPAEPAPTGIDPAVERQIILDVKAKHYATWPDLPIPALGGKTPRDAARTTEGRGALENLLRNMENTEERQRRAGRPAFDFSGLRRELGL